MTCEVIQTECIRVGDRVPVTLDFSRVIARRWRSGAMFASGDNIRGTHYGFDFQAGGDGQTGDREPKWPKTLGGTVQDGSIEWTAVAVSVSSLLKILGSVAWEVPSSFTVSGESMDPVAQTATAYLEPSATGTFEVIVRPTFNDTPAHKEGFAISIEVE